MNSPERWLPVGIDAETHIPLTRSQVRRWNGARASGWVADQISPIYLVPTAVDPALLARALSDVVQRHDPLCTRIVPDQNGVPVATLRTAPASYPITVIDLSGLPVDRQAAISAHYGARECAIPLDLAHNWPLRATLLVLDATTHILFFTLSHVVADGWSCGVLVKELQARYRALILDADATEVVAAARWIDYVEELEEQDISGRSVRDLDWWHTQLDGACWRLPLGGRAHAGGVSDETTLTVPFGLPKGTGEELRQLAITLHTTTFSVTLAAFATAVAHHAHAPEVLVTVPYAGREDEGHESLIGLFANNLMLRLLVDRGATFEALVHRTQDVLLDALDHASTPFHHVEERLRADRISIAAQLVIQVYPRSMCDATLREPNDVAFHLLGFRTAAQHRELGLYLVKPDEGPLNGWLTHQTAVTNPGEAVGILGSFSRLLLTALRMPDRPVEVLLQHAQRHPDDDGIDEAVPWEGDCWVTGESHFPIHLLM